MATTRKLGIFFFSFFFTVKQIKPRPRKKKKQKQKRLEHLYINTQNQENLKVKSPHNGPNFVLEKENCL